MRNDDQIRLLDDYQLQTEQLFNTLAAQYQLPSYIVNNDDSLEITVEDFVSFDIRLQ